MINKSRHLQDKVINFLIKKSEQSKDGYIYFRDTDTIAKEVVKKFPEWRGGLSPKEAATKIRAMLTLDRDPSYKGPNRFYMSNRRATFKNPVEERALNVVVVKSKTIAVNAGMRYPIPNKSGEDFLADQIRGILDHKRVLHPYGAISGAIPNKIIKKDEFTLVTKNKRGDEFRVELEGFDPSDTETFWKTVELMEAHIRKEENPVEDLPSLAETLEKNEELQDKVEELEEEIKNLESNWDSHECYSEEYSSAVERIDDADESLETLFYELRSLYEGIHLRKQTISLDELKRLSAEWMKDVERIRNELDSNR